MECPYSFNDDWLRLSELLLLVAAYVEVLGSLLLVIRVQFIMAVPAGRSVVFVTGNAKKLEEVRNKYFIPEMGCMFTVGVAFLIRSRKNMYSFNGPFHAACCAS